jgi:hypothetical protein
MVVTCYVGTRHKQQIHQLEEEQVCGGVSRGWGGMPTRGIG